MLEVVPGVAVWDVLMAGHGGHDPNQIGRTPPLSADKAQSHFPRLQRATGVPYHHMLFFDDCTWSDNCGNVQQHCVDPVCGLAPVCIRTPDGLTEDKWFEGLSTYATRGHHVVAAVGSMSASTARQALASPTLPAAASTSIDV
jgi:magnesium-dependent phosphatase 1